MSTQLDWNAAPRLLDLLIEEQQTLRAVDDFSEFHARNAPTRDPRDARSGRYEALIPSTLPGADQQYAFRVDLDACTGCKACVTACHSLNGLEDGELWRRVGLVEDGRPARAAGSSDPQTVTTACHHCESPACLSGCPVAAYEKDPITGIVRHLDDQCIGCRYCQLMCPYDVPSYSERLGIVRKCDMCQGRLASGEAPACVQGCPNEAISISIVPTGRASESMLLPVVPGAMPDSRWTRPATRYVSSREGPQGARPVDIAHVEPSAAHTPLALMLVLTQAAIGAVCLDAGSTLLPESFAPSPIARSITVSVATLLGLAGLAASFFHLGRPLWAFRAFLGLRTSWMSREILVLGGFAALLVATCVTGWVAWATQAGHLGSAALSIASLRGAVLGFAVVAGFTGLYCSVQIYAVTGRPLWSFDRTLFRFGTTALWLGLAISQFGLALAMTDASPLRAGLVGSTALLLIPISILKLEFEKGHLIFAVGPKAIAFERTRRLLSAALRRERDMRRRLLFGAGCLLPALQVGLLFAAAPSVALALVAGAILASGLAAECLERSLFFRSEAMPSMPGGV